MDLNASLLQNRLDNRVSEYYPQIGSTNDRALDWLAHNARAGSVVVADEQTKGRGRLGRVWYAPPGTALMFSYLLRPTLDELPYIGMMGALAVVETVETLGAEAGVPHVEIKWPNDVLVADKKLCGVLPEAAWQDTTLIGVVLGIGLNVRIPFTGTAFEATAISLEDVVGAVDRLEVLAFLLEQLDAWTRRLASNDLYEAWRGKLAMLGKPVTINGLGETVHGIAEDVDRQGGLLVRDDSGTLRRMVAGDIALG